MKNDNDSLHSGGSRSGPSSLIGSLIGLCIGGIIFVLTNNVFFLALGGALGILGGALFIKFYFPKFVGYSKKRRIYNNL